MRLSWPLDESVWKLDAARPYAEGRFIRTDGTVFLYVRKPDSLDAGFVSTEHPDFDSARHAGLKEYQAWVKQHKKRGLSNALAAGAALSTGSLGQLTLGGGSGNGQNKRARSSSHLQQPTPAAMKPPVLGIGAELQMEVWDFATEYPFPAPGKIISLVVLQQLGRGGCARVFKVRGCLPSSNSSCAAPTNSSCGGGSSTPVPGNAPIDMALKVPLLYSNMPWQYKAKVTQRNHYLHMEQLLVKEGSIMHSTASCDNIVTCYHMGSITVTAEAELQLQLPCLLMELAQGNVEQLLCNARDVPHGLSSTHTQGIVRQAACALTALHRTGSALHRDLKASNLLYTGSIDKPVVKLSDFGTSKVVQGPGDYGHTLVGTPEFMAPEQCDSSKGQDWRTDTWGLGLLVLQLRRGRLPFSWLSEAERDRGKGLCMDLDKPSCPYNRDQPEGTKLGSTEAAFVRKCLNPNVSSRPAVERLVLEDKYLFPNYAGG